MEVGHAKLAAEPIIHAAEQGQLPLSMFKQILTSRSENESKFLDNKTSNLKLNDIDIQSMISLEQHQSNATPSILPVTESSFMAPITDEYSNMDATYRHWCESILFYQL